MKSCDLLEGAEKDDRNAEKNAVTHFERGLGSNIAVMLARSGIGKCEAFDRPDQKAMLVRELLIQCPDTTVISGNGMAGYADTNEIKTQQMMKRLYVCGDQSTDVGNGIGLIAPRVAACAAHEANKVLQLIMQAECE